MAPVGLGGRLCQPFRVKRQTDFGASTYLTKGFSLKNLPYAKCSLNFKTKLNALSFNRKKQKPDLFLKKGQKCKSENQIFVPFNTCRSKNDSI